MIIELNEFEWELILKILGEELERIVSRKDGADSTGEVYDLTQAEEGIVRSIKRIGEQLGNAEWSRRGDE